MKKCTCTFCKFMRRYRRLKKQITPAVDKFIDDFMTHYLNELEDADVTILKLKEQWPKRQDA
jgi:hypothetical protein